MGIPYAEVIGDPIAHSKSPLIHKFWLEKLGIAGDFRAVQVTADELPHYLGSHRDDPQWRGCNVAMPHKVRVWRLLGYAARDGRDGIVNCVARGVGGLEGHNFDADALMRTIPASPTTGGPIAIIGSGGAARAAMEALLGSPIVLIARNEQAARALLGDVGDENDSWLPLESADKAIEAAAGLINATPLGMAGAPPVPENMLRALSGMCPGAFVYDMVYHPAVTDLVRLSRERGMTTIDGLTMLIEQAALSFARFFGSAAPRAQDAALRELLTR